MVDTQAIFRRSGGMGLMLCALPLCAFLVLNGAAEAQTAPRPVLQSRTIDLSNLRLALPREETTPGLIDFENVQGRQVGAGVLLSEQYAESHGVRFGRGASVHYCARLVDDVSASLCPYPQAASGQRVAAHDVRSGGAAMVMTFERPVEALTMRINPTGGVQDEVFVARITGFGANREQIVQENIRFNWYQDAFSWPTSAGFETDGAEVTRVTVELQRASVGNRSVRFLIDDLTLAYSPERKTPPVAAALAEDRTPPKVEAVIVQSPSVGPAQQELRLYPAATRKRAAIDWDAVEAALAEQDAQGLAAASHDGDRFINAAELPVLLPALADAGSLIVVGNKDSYSAHFTVSGRAHSLYGSRLLTVMTPANGATPDQSNLTLMRSNEALIGSFSLYGASYSLTRHCINEDVATDLACHNADALGDVAEALVVVVGAAGRGRP